MSLLKYFKKAIPSTSSIDVAEQQTIAATVSDDGKSIEIDSMDIGPGTECDTDTDTSSNTDDNATVTESGSQSEPQTKRIKRYKQKFRQSWKEDFSWLEDLDESFWCRFCNQKLHGGKTQLERHEKTSKHIKNYRAVRGIPKINKVIEKTQATNQNLENKIVMFAVEHNISFNSLNHLTHLIKEATTVTNVKDLKLSRTKGTSIVIDKLGPHQLETLASKLRKTKFSIIMDESTDISANKNLAVTVIYFDEKVVKNEFLCLVEVPKADAKTLFNSVQQKLDELHIDFKNIVGYGADNASVMMGDHTGVKSKFQEINPYIFSMGCICHSLDLCSSAAAEKIPSTIHQFIHDIYNHFAHSAKRKHLFKEYQTMCETVNHMILRPCETRWLSSKACIDRILEQWIPLRNYFEGEIKEDKLPTTKNIDAALKRPVYKLYLLFLSYVLDIIAKMNTEFQSEKPKIHKLYLNITSFYRTLLSNYLKQSYLKSKDIHLINPQNSDYYLPVEECYIGPKAQMFVDDGNVASNDLKAFRIRVLDYYVSLCLNIRKKFDFNNEVLKNLYLIDPTEFTNCDKLFSIVPLAKNFPNLCDNINTLEAEYRELQCFGDLKKMNGTKIEEFWYHINKIESEDKKLFANISEFAKTMLCLPHSSAEVERIFSKINSIKTRLRNKLNCKTVENLLLAKDLLKKSGMPCYSFNLSKSKISNVDAKENEEIDVDDVDKIIELM